MILDEGSQSRFLTIRDISGVGNNWRHWRQKLLLCHRFLIMKEEGSNVILWKHLIFWPEFRHLIFTITGIALKKRNAPKSQSLSPYYQASFGHLLTTYSFHCKYCSHISNRHIYDKGTKSNYSLNNSTHNHSYLAFTQTTVHKTLRLFLGKLIQISLYTYVLSFSS